jgi:hypothetical protein
MCTATAIEAEEASGLGKREVQTGHFAELGQHAQAQIVFVERHWDHRAGRLKSQMH